MNELEKIINSYNKGEYKDALQRCNELLTSGNTESLLYWKATNLLRLNDFVEAELCIQNALALYPQSANLLSLNGVILFHLKKNKAALHKMNLAVSLEPQNPYRYSSRAFIKDAMGDTSGAIEDYEITIDLDPDDAIAHNNIGLLKEKLGYKERAKKHYEKADRLAVNNEGNLVSLDSIILEEESSSEHHSFEGGLQERVNHQSNIFGWKYYFKTVFAVLTSPKERKAFWRYISDRFKF